jgi:hypothetical protein
MMQKVLKKGISMKIRTGFVSNSSSSSFICSICDEVYFVMDGDPRSDDRLAVCENDHAFCVSHVIEQDKIQHPLPKEHCPICSFKEITEADINAYAMARIREGFSPDEIKEGIKERFETYEELQEYINQYHPTRPLDIDDDY